MSPLHLSDIRNGLGSAVFLAFLAEMICAVMKIICHPETGTTMVLSTAILKLLLVSTAFTNPQYNYGIFE